MSGMGHSPAFKVKKLSISYFLPIVLLAINGSAFSFLRVFFNINTRWIAVGILFFFILLGKNFLHYMDKKTFFVIGIYIAWCFFTSFWSPIPVMSILKSTLLLLIAFTMISAGIVWVKTHPLNQCINFSWIIAVVSIASGIFGQRGAISFDSGQAYQGLVSNSNMFAILLVMSLPLLIWKCWQLRRILWQCSLALVPVLVVIYYLLLSMSRAAMLAAAIEIALLFFSLKPGRKAVVFCTVLMLLICGLATSAPEFYKFSSTFKIFVYKSKRYNMGIFSSRAIPWRLSIEGAQAGSWIGLGYGVSKGFDDYNFEQGLSTLFYGREKGNSQLAIMEETGIIGILLYSVVIIFIFIKLANIYFSARDEETRVLLGIVCGVVLGMIAHSIFEGWWDAPGSPEFTYFWLMIGVVRGLEISLNQWKLNYEQSVTQA